MTLTAITSLVALVSMPIVVQVAMRHFLGADSPIEFSVAKMVRGVFFITTVPVAVGMLLRAWQARWADQLQNALGRIATTLFVLIVIATFVSQRDALMANLSTVGPAAASLNLGVMLAGAGLALAFGLGRRDAIAITSECGLQNAALGIFIATTVSAHRRSPCPASSTRCS